MLMTKIFIFPIRHGKTCLKSKQSASLSDITEFLEKMQKKVSEDGFALTDSGDTVIEIIQ